MAGPMVTVGLPEGFRIEVDALFRRVGYRTGGTDILGGTYFERQRANSWEFPILLRKTIAHGLYATTGYAPRGMHGSGHADVFTVVDLRTRATSYFETDIPGAWRTTHGIVAGAGIEKGFGRVRIAPEIRYTYWTGMSLDIEGSRGLSIQSGQHQLDLLVGITFP